MRRVCKESAFIFAHMKISPFNCRMKSRVDLCCLLPGFKALCISAEQTGNSSKKNNNSMCIKTEYIISP